MEQHTFENKVKPVLLWMGTVVASIMAIAYIIVVFVLIEGFKAETILNTSLFSFVTAVIGFCIMQMLKIQGKAFAENIPENKEIQRQYTRNKTKDKKARSMRHFWVVSGLADVLTRCLTLGVMSVGMVYIMIEGNKDYSLLLLASVNLLMFAGFGLLSMVSAYDYYNNSYVPYMLEKINEVKDEETMEMAKKEHIEQRNDSFCSDSGNNILEPGMGNSTIGTNTQPVVFYTDGGSRCVLGGTIHPGNRSTDSVYNVTEEIIQQNKETEAKQTC